MRCDVKAIHVTFRNNTKFLCTVVVDIKGIYGNRIMDELKSNLTFLKAKTGLLLPDEYFDMIYLKRIFVTYSTFVQMKL